MVLMRRLLSRLFLSHAVGLAARRFTVRLTGAAIATGGLALLGLGTVGSPVVSGGGAQLVSDTTTSVTGITVNPCTGGTATGTVTVSNPMNGETLTLEVTYHTPGSSTFVPTGGTETIDIVAGTTTYDYSISFTGVSGANTYRVEIVGATPTASWNANSLNAKSDSFSCAAPLTTTSSTTSTTSTAPGSSTTSSTTSVTSNTPGTVITSTNRTTVTSTAAAGVRGATTGTPSTGADVEFGLGLGLMIGGAGLALGAGPLFRRFKK